MQLLVGQKKDETISNLIKIIEEETKLKNDLKN